MPSCRVVMGQSCGGAGRPGTPSHIPPAQGLALLGQTAQGSRSDNQPNVSIHLSKRQQFLFQGEQNNKTH